MTMFYALVILCLSASALAQSSGRGSCPPVTVQRNFDLEGFLGRWYERQRHYHNFEYTSKCNVIDYGWGTNSTLFVVNAYIDKLSEEPGSVRVPIYVPNKREPAKMLVHMPMTPPGTISNYWVLGTDYDNYVVIWGCTEFEELNLTYAWILTRERYPEDSVIADAYEVLDSNGLDKEEFFKVDQEDCENDDDDDDHDDDDYGDDY